ncbi:tRNA (adenosine(37)-N6)-dimethylallyltransferase MiaA [Methylopila henanensis]|uniref:tRNA dimethylallyltransferase n=1 Tax=Methylopila henanensis TaxID=873516 RepID=A0ABW4K0I1_9HYPH
MTQPVSAILIAGPTASGKSGLALALAERLGGVVVNADALQVYADLRTLTARPPDADLARAPHALYGHVDGAAPYAVGRWLDEVAGLLGGPRLPIVVGGTGLYFDALTRGLSAVPEIAPDVRERWRAAGPDVDLHAELARRDPLMAARLRPSDPQRLMRALEVIESTGRSLRDWQNDAAAPLLVSDAALRIVLAPDRKALDARIATRLGGMIEDGAAEEAERLVARGLPRAAPVMKALGVQPLAAWRRGEIARDDAVERTRVDTRRYAKRQSTWFRNRMQDWRHAAPDDAFDLATGEIERRGRV